MLAMIINLKNRFTRDEDGLALTEYLVLLGLLVGGVIGAVIVFRTGLAGAWTSWGTFFTTANITYR